MTQHNNSTYKVTFSLVIYKQPLEELREVVKSLLLYKTEKKIFIVDNSPTDTARVLTQMDKCMVYRHIPENVGFGRAHNWAINQALKLGTQYHFVVNPDIFFDKDIISPMIEFMDNNPEVGQMMPKILYTNGETQYLPKLMPSPRLLIQRKLGKFFPGLYKKWMTKFEMRTMCDDRTYEVGHVSGCFSVMRREAIERCGLYDDRFFMYFEDTDLTRRIHRYYRTIYYPMVSVYHGYGNGASKNSRLFFIFLSSLIKFFNKWGWCLDSERRRCNREFLKQLPADK